MPNYIRRFGLVSGVRLLFQIEKHLPHISSHVRSFDVPGLPAPIHLRDCVGDHAIFWQCIVSNQYDFDRFPQASRLRESYARMVGSGQSPLIIDCGGNVGLATIWFAMALPEAKICVVEPDPENYEMLVRNTEVFGNRVISVHGGVWPEGGQLRIANPGSGPSARQVAVSENTSENSLNAYTIEDLCQISGAESAFIVKIDIEGAQEHLFERNTDWVAKTQLIALELDDWQFPWRGTSRPFFSCVSRYPFDYLLAEESIFCFRDLETA
jgi:FkbM family methyltransferase